MLNQELSLLVAFLGGMLTLLPACGPALLPAFFGYTFYRKQDLARAVMYFGLGFGILFVPLSLGVNFLVNLLVDSREIVFRIAGLLLIGFGILSILNFSFPIYSSSTLGAIRRPWDALFLGMVIGLTSSSCIAPIYGAILSLNILSQGVWQILLLIFFLLGMIIPLFLLAYLFNRYEIRFPGIIKKSHLISGLTFIFLGLWLASAKGLGVPEVFDYLNTRLLQINPTKPYWDFVALLMIIGYFVFLLRKRYNKTSK